MAADDGRQVVDHGGPLGDEGFGDPGLGEVGLEATYPGVRHGGLRLLYVHQQQLGEGLCALQQGPGQFLAQEATAAGDDDLHLVILRLVHV